MILGGYFARRVMPGPEHLNAPGVREICSVSECMPEGQRDEFRLFAYRIHPERFRGRERVALTLPDDVGPEPLPAGFGTVGFDGASKFSPESVSLECSPRFAVEQPEPGEYYVVEVLEGARIDPSRSTNAERASN